jgi:hypothetical protein
MENEMSTETIRSGGLEYDAAWVRSRVSASFKPDEALVRIQAEGISEPLAFYVDTSLVRPAPRPGEEIDGEVKVVLLDTQNGSAVIEVMGESVSYGPKISVPRTLLTDETSSAR